MEVAGWIERDPGADPIGRGEAGMPVRRITGRGAQVLREDAGWGSAPVLAARASDFPHIHPPRKFLSRPVLWRGAERGLLARLDRGYAGFWIWTSENTPSTRLGE